MLMQYWRDAPPIVRTLAAVTFIFSLLAYTGVLDFNTFVLIPAALVKLPPELWRLVTPFIMTEGSIGILFDTYFLYKYGAKLEIASPRFQQRAEFITYILFNCLVILALNIFLGARVLAFPLAIAFITTSTLDSWDVPTSLFGVVTFPSQYLPYALLLITLICSGPEGALIHATGLAGAHLYEVFTGAYAAEGGPSRNFIQAPEFLKKVCGTRTEVSRPYGTVLNAAGPSGPATSAWGVGWGKWGKGQRLGGDLEGAVPVERERSNIVKVVIVVVFVVTACGLGVLFMMHRDPEGWWTTLRGALFGGDISSTTTPPKDPGLVKNPTT